MKDRTPTCILVAIDFSAASRRALRYARDLAMQFRAELHVAHVAVPQVPLAAGPDPVAVMPMTIDDRKLAESRLATWSERCRDDRIQCKPHLLHGEPAAAILACAREIGADHLVLGAHGHSRFHDFLLGSVAREVQGKADCPVTTVRAAADDDEEEFED